MRGINPNSLDSLGRTPLHKVQNPKVIEVLIKAGGDPNTPDQHGGTPLHYNTSDADTASALILGGADPNRRDDIGKTPLHYADDVNVVKILLGGGADPNIRDNTGKTPVAYAPSTHIANALLSVGADIEEVPLMVVSSGDVILSRLQKGTEVETRAELTHVISVLLNKFDTTSGQDNRVEILRIIFDLLITPLGLNYVAGSGRFKEVLNGKLLEFIQIEPDVFKPYYIKIFGPLPM